MTLAEFLETRIAENEAAASQIGGQHWWAAGHPADSWIVASDEGPVVYNEGAPTEAEAAHMARWDPARVLAECEAKRRIVEWHPAVSGTGRDGEPVIGCANCIGSEDGQSFTIAGPCLTLRLLALPYADHPDYQPEWKP